jgi:hypothetical protein
MCFFPATLKAREKQATFRKKKNTYHSRKLTKTKLKRGEKKTLWGLFDFCFTTACLKLTTVALKFTTPDRNSKNRWFFIQLFISFIHTKSSLP